MKSLKDLVALAKAKSGLTYGSNGIGSSQHLAGALFGSTFGLNLVHVPYKGTGPMTTDLVRAREVGEGREGVGRARGVGRVHLQPCYEIEEKMMKGCSKTGRVRGVRA